MINKLKCFSTFLICLLLTISVILCNFCINAFAQDKYISEIAILSGKDSISKLENKDFNVLFQGMNIQTDDSSLVYLGYKKGGKAITNIIVSTKNTKSISVDSVTYTLASSTSLNKGTDGTPIYLYYTKDEKAGDGITSLDTISGISSKDDVNPLKNDGTSPVRDENGKLANLDKGIEDNEIYLLINRGLSAPKYISNAYIVSANSKISALKSAVNKGCDYYLEYNLKEPGKYSYIAYQRTPDKSQAITNFEIKDSKLSTKHDPEASSYLLDVSNDKLFEKEFTVSKWAKIYSYTMSSKDESAFANLLKDKTKCSCVLSSSNSSIYALYEGKFETKINESTTKEQTTTEDSTYVTDEYIEITKDEESTTETTEVANDSQLEISSILGKGNVKVLIIMAGVILGMFVISIIIKRRNKKDEEN